MISPRIRIDFLNNLASGFSFPYGKISFKYNRKLGCITMLLDNARMCFILYHDGEYCLLNKHFAHVNSFYAFNGARYVFSVFVSYVDKCIMRNSIDDLVDKLYKRKRREKSAFGAS